jgi:hypothetical protein
MERGAFSDWDALFFANSASRFSADSFQTVNR